MPEPARTRRLATVLVIVEWAYAAGLVVLTLLTALGLNDRLMLWLPATFLPYLPLPLLPVVGWALARRLVRRHLGALVACGLIVLVYAGQFVPSSAKAGDEGLVVMTFNVRHSPARNQAIRSFVAAERPHILALQEVRRRQGDDDLLRLLASDGYTCEHRPYYEGKSWGPALCARPPVVIGQVQRRTYHARGRWSYLFAEAHCNDHTVNLIVPHLLSYRIDPVSSPGDLVELLRRVRRARIWHRQETGELLRLIRGFRDPTIMAGDFNSTPEHAVHTRIRRHLRDAFREAGWGLGTTFHFILPIRIDYIYTSPEIEVLESHVGPAGLSDHRPVLARVRLATPS